MAGDLYAWLAEVPTGDLPLMQLAVLLVGLDAGEVALLVSHRTTFDATREGRIGEWIVYLGLPFCLCVLIRMMVSLSFLVVVQSDHEGMHNDPLVKMIGKAMRILTVLSKVMAIVIGAMTLAHQGGRETQLLLALHGLSVLFLMPAHIVLRRRLASLPVVAPAEAIPEFDVKACSHTLKADLDEACVICLERLVKGEEVAKLACEHCFHKHCLEAWVKKSASCPLRCELAGAIQPEKLGASEAQAEEEEEEEEREDNERLQTISVSV